MTDRHGFTNAVAVIFYFFGLSKNGATLIPGHSLSVVMTVPYGLRSSKRTITITTIKPEILPQASVKSIVAVPTDITMP